MTDRSTPAGAGLPEPTHAPLFGAPEPDPEPQNVDPNPDPEGGDPPDPEALAAENADLKARLTQQTQTVDALIQRAPAQPATPRAPAPPPPPPDPGDPPDAASDPEGFGKWLKARDTHRDYQTDRRLEAHTQATDRDALLNRLWMKFQQRHPEVAKDEAFVTAAFQVETGGRIPADSAGQDQMIDNIADRIRGQGGAPKGGDPKPNGDADRTGGLSGGSRAPRTPKSPKPEPVKSLKDAIGDRQINSPFY
jgi:hypothetical protein